MKLYGTTNTIQCANSTKTDIRKATVHWNTTGSYQTASIKEALFMKKGSFVTKRTKSLSKCHSKNKTITANQNI